MKHHFVKFRAPFFVTAAAMLSLAHAQDMPRAREPIANPPVVEPARPVGSRPGTTFAVNLPDLRPTKVKAESEGMVPEQQAIYADIVNEGNADSAATEVLVTVAVIDPRSGRRVYPTNTPGNIAQSQFFRVPLVALTPGQKQRVYAGLAVVPNRTQDWDLGIEVTADAPAGVINGHVAESNERNNQLYRLCRLYKLNATDAFGPVSCAR